MASEVAPAQHGSGAGKHELGVRALEVFAKQVAEKGGQCDEPARRAGLGLIDISELASDLLERATDARLSLEQVQPISLEASELAPARARVRRCMDQRGEVLTDRIPKPRDLDGV